jgi:DNA (cytosine-5)-methyltransferase 1
VALTSWSLTRPTTPTWTSCFQWAVVEWYAREGRQFPWRRESNPYAVLVAELLLQKTDAPKANGVYAEFLSRWPTPSALARAKAQQLRSLIGSLGLAYRTERLKQIAEVLCKKHDGKVPRDVYSLMKLPGVGKYVASAVRCFGFGEPAAIVDTNVVRILGRACRTKMPASRPWEHSSTWALAASLLPDENVREYNWGLLDLAAIVCLRQHPRCGICPVRRLCHHHRRMPMRVLPIKTVESKPTAVDLFAGAGGLALGFKQAGFHVALAVEKDPYSIDTYTANLQGGDTAIIEGDVSKVDFRETLQISGLKPGSIDVLLAGPPCKGYSIANRVTRYMQNPSNKLYLQFLRAVDELKPKWVVFENVASIVTFAHGHIVRTLTERLAKLGYSVTHRVLNTADYGIPQVRRRFILVGTRVNSQFSLPPASSDGLAVRRVTVRDAIADLPHLENGNKRDILPYRPKVHPLSEYQRLMRAGSNGHVQNCSVTLNNTTICKRYQHIPQGGNWENIPANLMRNYEDKTMCHTSIYRRLSWSEPAHVLSNIRKNMLVHPSQHRGLSVREAARLQSFPDAYRFCGTLGAQQQQVADAVPPLLARCIAERIAGLL